MEVATIVYASRAAKPLSEEQLHTLATHCLARNKAREVTSVLIYRNGLFLQMLEGRPVTIFRLFERISMDPRHSEVRQILSERTNNRLFTGIPFGLSHVPPLENEPTVELNEMAEVLINASPGAPGGVRAVGMLRLFREYKRTDPDAADRILERAVAQTYAATAKPVVTHESVACRPQA